MIVVKIYYQYKYLYLTAIKIYITIVLHCIIIENYITDILDWKIVCVVKDIRPI